MIRLAVKTILLLSVIFIAFSFAGEYASWDNDGVIVRLKHDPTNGPVITYEKNGGDWCSMWLKDVTPARFALVYNTLKEFMIDDSGVSLRVLYNDGAPLTITGVELHGKAGN